MKKPKGVRFGKRVGHLNGSSNVHENSYTINPAQSRTSEEVSHITRILSLECLVNVE